MKFYTNLKKVYKKFTSIMHILFDFILSYAMLTEWYNRGMFSMTSIIWLLLSLSLFTIGIRKILQKPPLFLPLFKQVKTILLTFVISLSLFTHWFDSGMSSIPFFLGALLFLIISITIGIRKILNKPSLGELLKQFRNRYKK